MGRHHQLRGTVVEHQKLSERDRCILKRTVSKHHRTAESKVTAEFSIHLEDPDSTKTVRRELHISNIHDRVATDKPLIIENNIRTRNRWCDDHKTWTSYDWQYVLWSDNRPSSCSQHQAECPR
jgi:triphosphoribosyl-dephospho-CoA synthetase